MLDGWKTNSQEIPTEIFAVTSDVTNELWAIIIHDLTFPIRVLGVNSNPLVLNVLISVFVPVYMQLPELTGSRQIWHYRLIDWDDFRKFSSSFLCRQYAFHPQTSQLFARTKHISLVCIQIFNSYSTPFHFLFHSKNSGNTVFLLRIVILNIVSHS